MKRNLLLAATAAFTISACSGLKDALNAHTDSSGPVQRGYFVRQSIFCQNPPPMPEVVPEAPTVDDSMTTRDQFSQHETDPAIRRQLTRLIEAERP